MKSPHQYVCIICHKGLCFGTVLRERLLPQTNLKNTLKFITKEQLISVTLPRHLIAVTLAIPLLLSNDIEI